MTIEALIVRLEFNASGPVAREEQVGLVLSRCYVFNPGTRRYDRVRKDQVTSEHTHYYDDETGEWYEVKR